MTHIGLFEGIGGFSLAARWMGWDTIAWCEWNEFCQKVLKYHFPNAKQHGDITKTDFTIYRGQCDILTGGFPCQPYSTAGKRLGKEDERHLWPEMLRAIQEIQPRWIVGENVLGLLNWNGGMVFDEVCAQLEAKGYYNTITPTGERKVIPVVLPASGVDAPHQRYRVWFVAHSDFGRSEESKLQQSDILTGSIGDYKQITTDKPSEGLERSAGQIVQGGSNGLAGCDNGTTSDTESVRINRRVNSYTKTEEGNGQWVDQFNSLSKVGDATNTGNQRLQRGQINGSINGIGTERNEQFTGFLPSNWQNFPTQSPLCNGNDGLSAGLDLTALSFSKWRNESIKAGGNAIVPQVALELFKAIEQYETQLKLIA